MEVYIVLQENLFDAVPSVYLIGVYANEDDAKKASSHRDVRIIKAIVQ